MKAVTLPDELPTKWTDNTPMTVKELATMFGYTRSHPWWSNKVQGLARQGVHFPPAYLPVAVAFRIWGRVFAIQHFGREAWELAKECQAVYAEDSREETSSTGAGSAPLRAGLLPKQPPLSFSESDTRSRRSP